MKTKDQIYILGIESSCDDTSVSIVENRAETPCDIRTEYQRDRDRILHSKAFRRLKQKTQVFLIPEGDHYRTRMTHTLEVSQISRTVAKALRLNDDLTDAIALGHDLGHTPFGHAGERALDAVCSRGFQHAMQSLRVVEVIEKNGDGLNLTREVRDGILNHRTMGHPSTLEGQIVRICDKIAYINRTEKRHGAHHAPAPEYADPRCSGKQREPGLHPHVRGNGGGHEGASRIHVPPCIQRPCGEA